jgi:hypothetical protein
MFLLHPIQVQAVAYGAGSADVFCCFGLLLVLVALLQGGPAVGRVLMGLLGAGIALTSKESGVFVFALVPMVAYAKGWRPSMRLAMAGAIVGVLAGTWLFIWTVAHVEQAGQFYAVSHAMQWAGLQATAIQGHLVHLLWPFRFTPDADIETAPNVVQFLSLVGFVCWGALAWGYRTRTVGVGLAWAWVWLLPRLVIQTPWSFVNEHQFYAAMVGIALVGASAMKGRA